jgi:tetratricopeptide (TPR) repeat protein
VAYLRLGQIYRRRGESEKALENFNKANAIMVGSVEVAFNIAILYEDMGKYDKAEIGFKQLLKLTEKSSGSYSQPEIQNRSIFLYHAGLVAQQSEKYSQALDYFSQLKALNPNGEIRADSLMIETHRLAKQLNKALELCDELIKANPADRDYKIQRAELLSEDGKSAQAIQELRQLLTGGEEDLKIDGALVQVYQKDKNFVEAEKTLLTAEKLFKNKEQYYFMLGAIYERQKDFEKAEATFRKALEINSKNSAVLNYMGYMWADQNVHLEEALEMLKKAVNLEPNNGAYLDSLGWIYFRLNQFDQAETYLKKALERVRKDPTIHEHLGDLYAHRGQLKEARAAYEFSIANSQDDEEGKKIQKKLNDLKAKLDSQEKSKLNQEEGRQQ